jgi:hypothetical protein
MEVLGVRGTQYSTEAWLVATFSEPTEGESET